MWLSFLIAVSSLYPMSKCEGDLSAALLLGDAALVPLDTESGEDVGLATTRTLTLFLLANLDGLPGNLDRPIFNDYVALLDVLLLLLPI